MTEQNLKPGDTVDPRTLPVGAEFRYQWSQWVHRVIEVGVASELCETAQRCSFGCDPAVLVRLPQPSAEREAILWDELGTPRQKQPDCLVCGEDEIGSHFDRAWCHRCAWQGSLTALLARATAEPKRPPCDACGDESCTAPGSRLETWNSDSTSVKLGELYLCREHWLRFGEEGAKLVRARRAKHSSGSDVASSLPTYDQIAGWLGSEWVITLGTGATVGKYTWLVYGDGSRRCYLKHTTTGQLVEVTAPSEAVTDWADWFDAIRRGWRAMRRQHVRWLDPDTKTSGSGQADQAKGGVLGELSGSPVAPAHMGAENHPSTATKSGDVAAKRPVTETHTGRTEPPEPEASRWQTKDPTRIAALEAKLAEQVASGGQDCAPARSLVERADRLRREQEARKFPLTNGDVEGREEAWGTDPYLQPGPRLMRFELPSDQRLDRKRTGR